jgi:hypothetical protein
MRKDSRIPKLLVWGLFLSFPLHGCAAYMKMMGSLPMTGSLPAVNTMSVPICLVRVSLTQDPGLRYDNGDRDASKPYLLPGEEKTISYPIRKDPNGAPAQSSEDRYIAEVYGCRKPAYTYQPGALLLKIDNIEATERARVTIR